MRFVTECGALEDDTVQYDLDEALRSGTIVVPEIACQHRDGAAPAAQIAQPASLAAGAACDGGGGGAVPWEGAGVGWTGAAVGVERGETGEREAKGRQGGAKTAGSGGETKRKATGARKPSASKVTFGTGRRYGYPSDPASRGKEANMATPPPDGQLGRGCLPASATAEHASARPRHPRVSLR